MAYTQAQIDKLRAAIATGALRVSDGDNSVEYRSLNEMKDTLRIMEAEVEASPAASGVRSTIAEFTRE